MVKLDATARLTVRACDYQRMLDDLLDRQPCDRWLKPWADANWDWVYGERYNRKARQLVDQGTGAAQQQALAAYAACLAGNPLDPTPTAGLSLRVGTRLVGGGIRTSVAPDSHGMAQRLSVHFGGQVAGDPDCPPVSAAAFLRDEYGLTWFSQDTLDPQGRRNYRFETGSDFTTDWANNACPDYENYFCFYGAPAQTNLFELRCVISRLYELTRTVVQETFPPPDVSLAPYDAAAAQTADTFMTWRGAITQAPLLAQFVYEYFNAETGELIWQYPNANGGDFPEGWFPLSPYNTSGSGTGARNEPWWGLGMATPPRWGDWTVRCICLALRMRLETWPQGLPIQHPDLLMNRYPLAGGGTDAYPRWKLATGITAYTPGMTDGLARFERPNLKVVYHGHSYRCAIDHVQVLEGIGYLYTLHFTNDTKFDFWFAYLAASVAYYRSDGSYVWGPAGNYPLMFHLPPFATRSFRVLQPLEGYWLDWRFLGDMRAPTPWVNPYYNTLQMIGSAAPVKPTVAEGLWTEVRDGDAGTRKALINTLASSNQVPNWTACTTYPPAAVLANPLLGEVITVESGISGQRLGGSYSLAAYVTYRDTDGQTYSTTRYFSWSQLSTALGLPSATHIEIALDGTGHRLVRNIGWWGGDTQGYCEHGLINRCDYWSSWDDFKAKADTAVRGLLPGSWTVLALDLRNPYVGFDFAAVPLNDVGWGARSGIVPSVSEATYPTRITVRV